MTRKLGGLHAAGARRWAMGRRDIMLVRLQVASCYLRLRWVRQSADSRWLQAPVADPSRGAALLLRWFGAA